ncbi:hypothetical protein CWI38_0385p0040 [Hamiltosporidium tvaerminnensis]|uniref:Uncharacterized protein n=1 Tax=Hamiltosporidium tvaerminnensis TaxID=1176355 RepID=A0A4Q9M068_9MICR|nr:hypothetical protein CWI38_0385p0040 [Hamiltosporidium tvaerminnensis]
MPRRAGKELEICVIKTVGIHGELTLELKQAGNEEDSELTININEDSDLREEKIVVKRSEAKLTCEMLNASLNTLKKLYFINTHTPTRTWNH